MIRLDFVCFVLLRLRVTFWLDKSKVWAEEESDIFVGIIIVSALEKIELMRKLCVREGSSERSIVEPVWVFEVVRLDGIEFGFLSDWLGVTFWLDES